MIEQAKIEQGKQFSRSNNNIKPEDRTKVKQEYRGRKLDKKIKAEYLKRTFYKKI